MDLLLVSDMKHILIVQRITLSPALRQRSLSRLAASGQSTVRMDHVQPGELEMTAMDCANSFLVITVLVITVMSSRCYHTVPIDSQERVPCSVGSSMGTLYSILPPYNHRTCGSRIHVSFVSLHYTLGSSIY